MGFFATFQPHETVGEGIPDASFAAAEASSEIDRSEGGGLAQQLIAPWARFTKGQIHRGEWLPTHLRGEVRALSATCRFAPTFAPTVVHLYWVLLSTLVLLLMPESLLIR